MDARTPTPIADRLIAARRAATPAPPRPTTDRARALRRGRAALALMAVGGTAFLSTSLAWHDQQSANTAAAQSIADATPTATIASPASSPAATAVASPAATALTATPSPTIVQSLTGDLIVTLTDESGTPLGGACFALVDATGMTTMTSCDIEDDFPGNGNTGFFDVASGDYTLQMLEAPVGYEATLEQLVTVTADADSTVTVATTATAPVTTAAEPPAAPAHTGAT